MFDANHSRHWYRNNETTHYQLNSQNWKEDVKVRHYYNTRKKQSFSRNETVWYPYIGGSFTNSSWFQFEVILIAAIIIPGILNTLLLKLGIDQYYTLIIY